VEGLVGALAAFRGRRVLVTGSTGFKGAWLCTWLVGLGAKVSGFGLAAPPEEPLFEQLRCEGRIDQAYGDVRDQAALRAAVAKFEPEIVMHLAAQALVRRGYDMPDYTFDTNVIGGVQLMEVVRTAPSVRALVFVTSDKCYLNKEWHLSYRENDELGGADPYSASKAAAEIAFSSYDRSFFANQKNFVAATTRAGNVIGGGDLSRDRIVPDCVRAIAGKAPIVLRNPDAIRPWQHVLEPLSGYLMLAACLLRAPEVGHGAWNFAPNVENVRTVHQLAERFVSTWGQGKIVVNRDPGNPHEANLLMLSADKAKLQLGWVPHWTFEQAIDATVDWYRAVGDGKDPVAVTDRQIADFVASAH
jgi:CDP-glucose 4,6-dehydratase